MKPIVKYWNEPDRAHSKPLYIADRGTRYSTLTGVTWLDDHRYLVAHRIGLRVGLFDLQKNNDLISTFELPHLVDDLTSRKIHSNIWEVVVSGCWDTISTTFILDLTNQPVFTLTSSKPHVDRTFSHGVRYDDLNRLCIAFSSGKNPRIEIAEEVYKLPHPWGARCVFFDIKSNSYWAIANSNVPKLNQYSDTAASIWYLERKTNNWIMKFSINGMHSDACEIYENRIWIPDQKLDRILGICLEKKEKTIVLRGRVFDFPHGLSVSNLGILAVTNYGNSSVVLINLNEAIAAQTNPKISANDN